MNTRTWLALLLFSFSPVFADLADDVRCREIAFSQSVENKDISAFESFIDDDARFVGASISRGPAEIADAWSVFFTDEGPRIKWRPQVIEVLENGNLALSRGPYKMITRDSDGKPVVQWGTFNSVWRKHSDDTWKVVFDAGNVAAEAPPEDIQALLDEVADSARSCNVVHDAGTITAP